MLLVTGGYIFFLFLVTFSQSAMMIMDKRSLAELKNSYEKYQEELNKNTLAAKKNDTQLLEKQLSDKQLLLQTLQSRRVTSAQCSFLSFYVDALSQASVPGAWLTHFNIDLRHSTMLFSGLTYHQILPISFGENLQKMTCFTDIQFEAIHFGRKIDVSIGEPSAQALIQNDGVKSINKKADLLEFNLRASPQNEP